MAWRSSGVSNDSLVANLVKNKLLQTDRVISAFKTTDRALFIPAIEDPYADQPQYLGYNATISAPHMHAAAIESLAPYLYPGASVMDVGSGSGYLVSIMCKLVMPGGKVVAIEHIPELLNQSVKSFKLSEIPLGEAYVNDGLVVFADTDGRLGYPGELFDAIHVGAAPEHIPEALISQLKAPGKMFIPSGSAGNQYVYEVIKDDQGNVTKDRKYGVAYVPLTDLSHYK
ncbi:protein-L-isoaspartate O-methyltransferase [Lipomyces oligophaga]|uniref:protein-L-isoaspartate O-methyltransferase n=1 Tax=Lipomyces oligophaga TaxID=45792 RepID=UPI0034CD9B04